MSSSPKQLLSITDGVFLVAGMVIGVGIFKLPGLVAANAASATHFFLAWIVGGIACLCGALVYAELSSRYPETGGEYLFLRRGFGEGTAFVFAWSRMTVIQTGAIAGVAFVFGEYATQLVSLGSASAALWAAIGVSVLTALNLLGTLQSKTLQKVMEVLLDPRARGDRHRRHLGERRPGAARKGIGQKRFHADDDLRAVHLRRLERGRLSCG